MQANGIRSDQVTQVRGFADQRLRKPTAPLDPSNRRISLIVQYIVKDRDEEEAKPTPTQKPETLKAPSSPEKPAPKPSPAIPESPQKR
jgi:chemotaxis protein MotB